MATPKKRPTGFKNEGDVKKYVQAVLGEMQTMYPGALWWFMPPANGYGRAGIPDFIGIFRGKAFGIETKFGANLPTPHQMNEMQAMVTAGSKMWLVRETSVDSFANNFCGWCALCS